ncbi:LpqB family beta-propeller domain-containing protein [Demequina sp.]|uniref:LpqB family beta-propeller domain-containing protein n=1 Tax=Demequina sp. TaxID=2050685 RepID=UPI003A8B2F0C
MSLTRSLVSLAAAALLLAGCASIPTEGPVEEGNADVSPVEPLVPIQEGPEQSDNPQAIVTGFLAASASGVATNFDVAREFLTDEAAALWDPGARTLVYDSGAVTPEWDEPTALATYEVALASAIDESGRRVDAADDQVAQIAFTLEQQSDGQWRISELEDGVVISLANFNRFYRSVDLVFATTDRTTAVPEVRWLPDNNIATAAARELIEGPSSWLADAVLTGFPAAASLAVQSVVVTDGVATVDLSAQSAGTADERALALEQMRLTLTALPTVTGVEVNIGGLELAQEGALTLAAAPVPDALAATIVQGRLGLWDGTVMRATPLGSGAVPSDSRGLARSFGGQVAFIVDEGTLVVSDALAGEDPPLVEVDGELEPAQGQAFTSTRYQGTSLVTPSYDRHGYVWTSETADPSSLVAIAADGTVTELATEWLKARTVMGLSVSRDGARVAVVSRAGGQPVVEVAALVRDSNGVPLGVGEPIAMGAGVGTGVDVSWMDTTTVGVLGELVEGSPTPLWSIEAGGATSVVSTIRDGVEFAVRSGEATLLAVNLEGRVEERSGSSWAPVATGVTEIAYSG